MKDFKRILLTLLFAATSLHAQQAVQIVSATPKGKTSSAAEAQRIVVTFNQPMIALKGLSEPMSSGPFVIVPNVAGTFRWLGTSSIEFQPSAPLAPATKFTVTIPAGIKAVANATLAQPYSWTFETIRPAVIQTWPENEAQHIHREAEILLRFNLPVNANAITNFITLTTGKPAPARVVRGVALPSTATRVPIKIRAATVEDLNELSDWQQTLEHVIIIKPQAALPQGEQINVTVLANMPATLGNLGTGAPFTLKFFTAEGFAFKDYEPKHPSPPLTNMTFHFSTPVAASDLMKHLKFNPEIEYPDYYDSWNWYEADLHLSFYFPPDTTITFTIDADLPDQFGNKLGKVATGKITTTGYDPEVRFSGGTGIVEADGDRRVPIEAMNYEGVNLGMRKLAMGEIIPLLNDQRAFYGAQVPPLTLTVQERLSFGKKRNFWNLRPIELKHGLAADSTGIVYVQVEASQPNNTRYIRGLYQVTHLGLTAKFSPRNNLVFVTNMKDASPVANAKIEVRDDRNQILWSGVTDTQGRCETPGWAELNIAAKSKWDQPRAWIFARKGNDLAFLHSEWGTGIYPYRFGIDYEWNAKPLVRTGVVMTDRGLYRTGETVYFKGIVREKDGTGEWRIPQTRAWQWRIEDARNQEVLTKMIYLSEYGAFDDSLMIDKNAPLGLYWMSLGASKKVGSDEGGENITNGSFRVEAFRPAEFEVNAFATNLTNAKRGYLAGDNVTAKIAGRYLFGSPMRNAEVKWRLQLMPSSFNSENFSDYTFRQWRGWYESGEYHSSQLLASGTDSLNAEGEIAIKGAAIPSGIPVPQSLLIEGEATSATGQTLAGRTSVAVHPAEFYIGLRTPGYFFAVNKAVACSVVTITPDDKLASNQRVKLRVIQRQWHSVRKAGVGWRYSWETTVEDTPVDSTTLTSTNRASAYLFTPKKSGYYILEAQGSDARGRTTKSAIFFYVSGADYVAWERGDDDRVELIPDRKRYKPGDVATIMVQSPFEKCRALLTIERESIFESRVLELTGTAPTIQIPIKENYLPNMFVSVALLQGRVGNQMFSKEGEDIGKPLFKIGYTNLTVDPGTRHLAVTTKSDRSDYRPGEMVRVSVDVKGPSNQGMESEVTLAVVDVGVLNLIGYKLPDPFGDFYGPRPLSVRTSETLLHLIEQRNYGQKAEATGGGGGFEGIDMRSDFRLTPLWLPALRTDANGHAEAQFKLPSNLTTFRIMAVAHTKQSHFGEGNNDFKVNKPLLMQAALPRFTRTGDRFEAGVAITNTTAQRGKVSLQLLARGVKALGDSLANFELAPGESRAIRKPFVAGVIGQAKYEFRARMQAGSEDFTDGLSVSIPIMMPQTKEVVATNGSTEDRAKEMLNVPGEIYADAGNLELTAASTAMVGLRESVNYLFEYPYGCLEQRLSRTLPMILAGDLVDAFKLQALKNGENYRNVAQAGLDEIPRYQTSDGGFALWAGQSYSWDYISGLTLYTMARAKQNNFDVNKKVFDRAKNYGNEQLRREFSASERMSERSFHYTRALLLHALVLSDEKPEDYLTYLFENREKLSLDGQCHLLRAAFLLKKTPMVATMQAELMNKVKVDPTMAHFEDTNTQELWWCYYSTARTTALCLQALVETRASFPMAENVVKWLMAERKLGRWRTTQENGVVFEALTTYFRAYEKDVPNFNAEIRVAGEKILQEAFQGRTTDVRRTEAALTRFAQQKDLAVEISKKGPGRFYYGMRMTYFPLKPGPSRDEGITIKKEIQRLATTNGVSAAYHPGEVVQIVLRVIIPQERHFVVVDDPLPAGFEAINPRLLTSSTEHQDYQSEEEYSWWRYGFDHVEKRDDRVLLFATWLSPGEHVYKYQARVTTPGTFMLPSTHAEAMYTPEVFGRFEGSVVEVK